VRVHEAKDSVITMLTWPALRISRPE